MQIIYKSDVTERWKVAEGNRAIKTTEEATTAGSVDE
jgi:hypothetical protein